jgi:hypothetical protein
VMRRICMKDSPSGFEASPDVIRLEKFYHRNQASATGQ